MIKPKGVIVVNFFLQMAGFPGSGKSTLSRKIAQAIHSVIIDHDIVKSALLESLDDLPIDSRKAGSVSYHIEWALIDFHLSQGHSVIFDSPCFYSEMVEKGVALANKNGAKYKYIECYLNDVEEIKRRLKSRTRMVSQIQTVDSEEGFYQAINQSKKPDSNHYLIIDSSQPLENHINKVLEYIKY